MTPHNSISNYKEKDAEKTIIQSENVQIFRPTTVNVTLGVRTAQPITYSRQHNQGDWDREAHPKNPAASTSAWNCGTARGSAWREERTGRHRGTTESGWYSAPPSADRRRPATCWPAPTRPGRRGSGTLSTNRHTVAMVKTAPPLKTQKHHPSHPHARPMIHGRRLS